MKDGRTPEASSGRLPLEGATLAARQSRLRGVRLVGRRTAQVVAG